MTQGYSTYGGFKLSAPDLINQFVLLENLSILDLAVLGVKGVNTWTGSRKLSPTVLDGLCLFFTANSNRSLLLMIFFSLCFYHCFSLIIFNLQWNLTAFKLAVAKAFTEHCGVASCFAEQSA